MEQTQKNLYAFDSHMHILPLKHVGLLAYLSFLDKNKKEEAMAVMSAPDYLVKNVLQNTTAVINMLATMEASPYEALCLYEDDLKGEFSAYGKKSIFDNDVIIANSKYKYLVLNPLILDFELPGIQPDIYYKRMPSHDVIKQSKDILEGIYEYRKNRPNGSLIVRPYIGVNPRFWSTEKLEEMLHTHFYGWSANADDILNTWTNISENPFDKEKVYANAFAGIKVYPPLGYDPYPDDAADMKKMDILYSFCEKKGIPIITHCDDQGFRMISQEDSFKWTNPERWALVLKKYPDLYLDIAHFGQQYYRGIKRYFMASWQDKIIELMCEYPHVYSDVSFGGVSTEMWENLAETFNTLKSNKRDVLETRLLFGTDWPLCLSKIESVSAYYKNFEDAKLSNGLKKKMLSTNACSFNFR